MKKHNLLGRIVAAAALMWLALALSPNPARADTSAPEIVVIHASGPVVQPFADYIVRGINEANRRQAEALLIIMDTPGGSVNITFDLIQKMRASSVPLIVFISPRGAKAASAGMLITLAGHASAMSPDTAIGASAPIDSNGNDLGDTAKQKAVEYISAEARSLAERRGSKATELASAAVTDARAVTDKEARDANLVDFIASDTGDLLKQMDGFQVEVNGASRTLHTQNAKLTDLPMTLFEEALLALTEFVTNPNITFLLLAGGILLLIVEFSAPGGWVAGALGTVSLGLALYGIGILPVNWLGMVFIVLSFVLFVLDVKAPTHGILTLAAMVSLAAGAIILFGQPEVAPFGSLSIPLVIGVTLLAGMLFFTVVIFAVRALKRQPVTGREGLIGQIGRVTTDLTPAGMVRIWGENWRAETVDGAALVTGSEVEVVEITGMRLRVRPH